MIIVYTQCHHLLHVPGRVIIKVVLESCDLRFHHMTEGHTLIVDITPQRHVINGVA